MHQTKFRLCESTRIGILKMNVWIIILIFMFLYDFNRKPVKLNGMITKLQPNVKIE